jgi:hypothetical protein
LPGNSKLLDMDNSIAVLDFLTECHDFILIHGPDFIKSVFITLFESLILSLEEQEFFCEPLIFLGVMSVELGILSKLKFKLGLDSS